MENKQSLLIHQLISVKALCSKTSCLIVIPVNYLKKLAPPELMTML